MRARTFITALLGVVAVVGLSVAGWSLKDDNDESVIEAFARRGFASVRWAVNGNARISSVCEIYRRAQSMNGRKVQFRAEFASDHLEHSYLIDPKCPREPIALADAVDLKQDAVSKVFNDLSWKTFPDGPHLINVAVVGFVESPPKSVYAPDQRAVVMAHRYLEAEDAGVDPKWSDFVKVHGLDWPGKPVSGRKQTIR